jgi:hypothetical protein
VIQNSKLKIQNSKFPNYCSIDGAGKIRQPIGIRLDFRSGGVTVAAGLVSVAATACRFSSKATSTDFCTNLVKID